MSTSLDGRPLTLKPKCATTIVDVGVGETSSSKRLDDGVCSVAPASNVTDEDPEIAQTQQLVAGKFHAFSSSVKGSQLPETCRWLSSHKTSPNEKDPEPKLRALTLP